ncbi:hypothetical protein MTR_5g088215 [Medicago truncatula]|uniref:Uncharacterized protein n=1 Tax=Medicago truncatula TaxID=3880 RepID=A0A072UGY4_MEDTR|nr:hypothetical protein MTR_5g088215 [Medicago truncatula]
MTCQYYLLNVQGLGTVSCRPTAASKMESFSSSLINISNGTLACSESITTHQVWPLLALEVNSTMQAPSVDADDIIYKQILACYAASVYVSAKPTSQANKIWCD